MSFPAAVPPAHILSAPADGVALATLCPPGPKQNTSSARTSPWMIQRKCCNGRTCRMSMTITVPEGSFCEALDEQCTSSERGRLLRGPLMKFTSLSWKGYYFVALEWSSPCFGPLM